jgi:hypothetical protein
MVEPHGTALILDSTLISPTLVIASGDRSTSVLNALTCVPRLLESLPEPWAAFLPEQLRGSSLKATSLVKIEAEQTEFSWRYAPGWREQCEFIDNHESLNFAKLLMDRPELALRIILHDGTSAKRPDKRPTP